MPPIDVTAPRARRIGIDSLRGLAVILVVAGHVIGGTPETGMRVDPESGWAYFYAALTDLRVPLFTALSGYVYSLRPVREPADYGQFVRGKARRLLVPLLTVGTLFILIQSVAPGTNASAEPTDVFALYLYGSVGGSGQFWFLEALFLILVVVGIADAFGHGSGRALAVAIAASTVAAIVVNIPAAWSFFAVDGAIFLLPFFLVGCALARFPQLERGRFVVLAFACGLFAVRMLEMFGGVVLTDRLTQLTGFALGLTGVWTLVLFRDQLAWRPLARLGYFSFAIFLLHPFGAAGTRILLTRMGIESDVVLFLSSMVAGLTLPIIFEITLGRIAWVSWAFLGQKAYRPRTATSRRETPSPTYQASSES